MEELSITTKSGKTYFLSRLKFSDLKNIALACKVDFANPLEVVGSVYDKLPEKMREKLIDRAYQDAVAGVEPTMYQMAQGLDTFKGMVRTILCSIQKRHPEVTEDEIADLVGSLDQDELKKLMDKRDLIAPDGSEETDTPPDTTT